MRGTLSDQFRDKHPFFWVVVVAAVIGVCSYIFVVAMHVKYAALAKQGYDWDNDLRLTRIYPHGPADGILQVGDKILKLDGKAVERDTFGLPMLFAPLNTDYTLEVERNGTLRQFALRHVLHRKPEDLSKTTWQIMLSRVFFSLPYLILGVLVGLLKPANASARLLSIGFMQVGVAAFIATVGEGFFPIMTPTERVIFNVFWTLGGQFIAFPVIYRFYLSFPQEFPQSRFWNTLGYLLFIGAASVYAGMFALNWMKWWPGPVFLAMNNFYFTLAGLAGVAVMVRNYLLVKDPQQRQRMKWMIWGVLFGVLPQMLWALAKVIEEQISPTSLLQRLEPGMSLVTSLLVILVPTSMAYTILKHRVLDINIVIRRSLRYLLISRGFIFIEALLAFAVLSFIFAGRIGAALDRLGSNTRTLVTILGTVLMVLGLQTVNRKIRPLIDRRFFRESYDAQQILTELASSLRATTNVNQVLELTSAQIQQALYASNVTIFLRNGQHDFHSAVSRDYHEREKLSQSVTRELHLPDEAFVVQRINESAQPAEIDWDDPYSPVATQLTAMANGNLVAQQEFETLRILQTNLVLPLAAKDELLGMLALGPRAGDLPYSREDKRMLMNVAGQTAMALENSRLIEQKIDLEAENERRAQELEEARQLQLSMLPKKLPQLPHLDIAALMKTATEVGGDYYDFHTSDDGTLTIAVGDATGHGLRAGMIVTATKSLFNELVREPDLPELMRRCSRALKAMQLRGLFMALTIARINGNRLTISSAGMPAALVYRAADRRVEELQFKSMPLGGLTNYAYKQQEVVLATGDVLVLLSDGLPERFNAEGEMLGEEKMVVTLREAALLSPSEIIRRLMQLGEDWGGARPQDDDATFVVVKVI